MDILFAADNSEVMYTSLMLFMTSFLWTIITLLLATLIFGAIVLWKIFEKAGQPGWYSLIPILNSLILMEMTFGRKRWFLGFFLYYVPYVGWILSILFNILYLHKLSQSFGKDTWFTILNYFLPLIGMSILAFDKSEYIGPVGESIP